MGKWRRRFLESGLDGLSDEPRPGAPRTISDEQVEAVVVATLERTPANATHWSRAAMAAESGLSRSTVGRIWKTFGLKPHQTETFKLSTDPQFIDKVRDIVGLYLDPPEKALVLCVDEKARAPRGADEAVRDERPATGHRSDRSKLEADRSPGRG